MYSKFCLGTVPFLFNCCHFSLHFLLFGQLETILKTLTTSMIEGNSFMKDKGFKIIHINVRSFLKKKDELYLM